MSIRDVTQTTRFLLLLDFGVDVLFLERQEMLRFYLKGAHFGPNSGSAVLDGLAIGKVEGSIFACRDIPVESFIQILVSVHVAQGRVHHLLREKQKYNF